jgi:hypothetical protein
MGIPQATSAGLGPTLSLPCQQAERLEVAQAPEPAEPLGAAAKAGEDGLLERRRFHFPAKRRDEPAAADL